jgi:hypothetical protein
VALEAKPIALGASVFAVGSIAVGLLPLPFDWLIYTPALFAGAVTGFAARDKRVHPLLVLGCVNAVIAGFLSLAMTPLRVAMTPIGMSEFPWRASLIAAALSLPFILGLGLVGWALVGVLERGTHA